MYLSSNPWSESLLTFRFTGAIQHNFVLKSHPTFPAHYPPTSPNLPHHYVSTSPTMPPHYSPTFPTLPHLTPLIHCSHLPSSLLSHLSQLTYLATTNRCFQNGNVLSLGRQGKYVWLIVRQPLMKAGWWDAPVALRDLAEAINMTLIMGGSPFFIYGSSLTIKFLP